MKRIQRIVTVLFGLLSGFSAFAEHQTFLRGIVNVPNMQVALIEIQHTLAKRTNAPSVSITSSRVVHAGERFEDTTIKGQHFQFEVLEIDFVRGTLKTREAGEEHVYGLPALDLPPNTKGWCHLKNAAFNDVTDLYSGLEQRVLLQHPEMDRAPVSLEAVWTNQPPESADVIKALVGFLNQRGISVVQDGSKFLQLVPGALKQSTSARSKNLPAGPTEVGGMTLQGAVDLIQMYSNYSGRRCTRNESTSLSVPYLKVARPLSKAELVYVLETLLAWNQATIVLGEDNTFSVVRAAQQPKRR